jgi:stearoyl-CoA desaturase (delta-9 desaturase)
MAQTTTADPRPKLSRPDRPSDEAFAWGQSLPFVLMHVACVAVFFVHFSLPLVALCVASYFLRMFFITAGYHRYFSHRTYKLGRVGQFVFAFMGTTATQKGVLWWAAHHRHHHKFSDQPADIHSPIQRGFWWSHAGWFLCSANNETRWELISDLAKFPELRWLNRWYLVPPVLYALAFFAIGGWSALVWGFVVSTVLLWHGTFTINSLSHVFGSKRYRSNDTSTNNWVLAFITMGEGWHNNHHAYMASANQGFFWWEYDFSFYILRALSWAGVTRDLRKPPLELLEAKRIDRATVDAPEPRKATSVADARAIRA